MTIMAKRIQCNDIIAMSIENVQNNDAICHMVSLLLANKSHVIICMEMDRS